MPGIIQGGVIIGPTSRVAARGSTLQGIARGGSVIWTAEGGGFNITVNWTPATGTVNAWDQFFLIAQAPSTAWLTEGWDAYHVTDIDQSINGAPNATVDWNSPLVNNEIVTQGQMFAARSHPGPGLGYGVPVGGWANWFRFAGWWGPGTPPQLNTIVDFTNPLAAAAQGNNYLVEYLVSFPFVVPLGFSRREVFQMNKTLQGVPNAAAGPVIPPGNFQPIPGDAIIALDFPTNETLNPSEMVAYPVIQLPT